MGRRSLALALIALIVAGCYTGEGSGRVVVAHFDMAAFTDIVLTGDSKVIVTPGEACAVSVSVEDDVLESLRVESDGGSLYLGRDVDWLDGIRPTVPIEFRVSLPVLKAVQVFGSGSAAIHGMEFGDDLRLETSGSGSIDASPVVAETVTVEASGNGEVAIADLRATTFRSSVGGAGDVSVAGVADEVEIRVSGSGLYRGNDLRASSTRVEVGGAGQAFVWAERDLEAEVGGAGRVVYRGNPAVEKRVREDDQVVPMDYRERVDGG